MRQNPRIEKPLLRGHPAAMPGEDTPLRVDEDRRGKAELADDSGDLGNLHVVVLLRVARVGYQGGCIHLVNTWGCGFWFFRHGLEWSAQVGIKPPSPDW